MVTKGAEKPFRSLSSADKDLKGLGREKEYEQNGEVGIAAENGEKYSAKNSS